MRGLVVPACVVGLTLAGCSSDPTSSGEYQELEQKLAVAEERIEELEAERGNPEVKARCIGQTTGSPGNEVRDSPPQTSPDCHMM